MTVSKLNVGEVLPVASACCAIREDRRIFSAGGLLNLLDCWLGQPAIPSFRCRWRKTDRQTDRPAGICQVTLLL